MCQLTDYIQLIRVKLFDILFSTESMGKDLEGTKCPPGQVWAYNKNPRCSLSFSDAVYEIASPDCPYPPSAVSITNKP